MCLNLGYTSHEIGWYLNFRQSNVYGWIFVSSFLDYSRKDARDASANEASHAHLTWKNISSTNMSIYCACRYIHIYIIYMYIMLYHIQHIGIPNFRLLGYCFEKSSCNGKKNVVWNLPWPLQQVAPCRLAGTDPANTSVRPGNPRRSLPLSSWKASTTRLHPGAG